jgi:hypothetical protein
MDTGDYVDELIRRLLELKKRSDPNGGEATASGKDLRAFEALETAGNLVEALAGWAIHHTCGRALEGLPFVPLQPSGTKNHPEYKNLRARVDDHRHEHAGARLDDTADPTIARKILIGLIAGNAGAWPKELRDYVLHAFEEREYGKQSPLFAPLKTRKKIGLREKRSQLRAVCCVEYLCARGMKKYIAQEKVADAYNVSPETIRSWENRRRNDLGALEVSRQISFAKNHASNAEKRAMRGEADKASTGESIYGEAALRKYGEQHRALAREEIKRGRWCGEGCFRIRYEVHR